MKDHAAPWQAYPMGPSLRRWLGLGEHEYRGKSAGEPSAEDQGRFADFLLAYAQEQPCREESQLIDVMDELLAMNLPLLVLKMADLHTHLWQQQDFRGLMAEAVAAMMTGDLGRAELGFRQAQRLAPEEPAPYVNLVQIMQQDGRWQEAWTWCEAGLDAEGNNFRLWELAAYHFQQSQGEKIEALLSYARQRHSWAGMSLAAERDPLANQQTKVLYLQPFYASGERSHEFLIEYTGALGAAGDYEQIPALIWQAEKMTANTLPWQLLIHQAQAQLAMDQKEAFLKLADKVKGRSDLPTGIQRELLDLMSEVKEELTRQ